MSEKTKHKIYCFNNGGRDDWWEAAAIGDDGHYLAGHICSHEAYMHHDLGISSEWKHDLYNAHFGEGNWKLEWIPTTQLKNHVGLSLAIRLNKTLTEEQHKKDAEAAPRVEITLSEALASTDGVAVSTPPRTETDVA